MQLLLLLLLMRPMTTSSDVGEQVDIHKAIINFKKRIVTTNDVGNHTTHFLREIHVVTELY